MEDPVNMTTDIPYHCKEGDTGIQGEDQYSGPEGLRSLHSRQGSFPDTLLVYSRGGRNNTAFTGLLRLVRRGWTVFNGVFIALAFRLLKFYQKC